MKKFFLVTLLLACFGEISYAQTGTPDNIRILTDANGSLLVKAFAQVAPVSQATIFGNARLITDSSGNLQVVLVGGLPSTSFPLLAPDGTAGAPSYSFSSGSGNGMWKSATNQISFSTNGAHRWAIDSAGNFIPAAGGLNFGAAGNQVGGIFFSGALNGSGIVNNVLGTSADARALLTLGGVQALSASESYIGLVAGTMTPAVGNSAHAFRFTSAVQKAGSGTHAIVSEARFEPLGIIAGAATITNAATVDISGPGTGGTNNYSLLVEAGNIALGGDIITTGGSLAVANVGANSCGTTAATIAGNDNNGDITVGATSGTQCRVTFSVAAPNRRDCTVSDGTTTIATRATYVDTTHTDFLGAFVAGDIVTFICHVR